MSRKALTINYFNPQIDITRYLNKQMPYLEAAEYVKKNFYNSDMFPRYYFDPFRYEVYHITIAGKVVKNNGVFINGKKCIIVMDEAKKYHTMSFNTFVGIIEAANNNKFSII